MVGGLPGRGECRTWLLSYYAGSIARTTRSQRHLCGSEACRACAAPFDELPIEVKLDPCQSDCFCITTSSAHSVSLQNKVQFHGYEELRAGARLARLRTAPRNTHWWHAAVVFFPDVKLADLHAQTRQFTPLLFHPVQVGQSPVAN